MPTVKIYEITIASFIAGKQEKGFSLKPWYRDTDYRGSADDGGANYILPRGCEVAKTNTLEDYAIYHDGKRCGLFKSAGGLPILATDEGGFILRRANEQQ